MLTEPGLPLIRQFRIPDMAHVIHVQKLPDFLKPGRYTLRFQAHIKIIFCIRLPCLYLILVLLYPVCYHHNGAMISGHGNQFADAVGLRNRDSFAFQKCF